jgi:hypothetical protein
MVDTVVGLVYAADTLAWTLVNPNPGELTKTIHNIKEYDTKHSNAVDEVSVLAEPERPFGNHAPFRKHVG